MKVARWCLVLVVLMAGCGGGTPPPAATPPKPELTLARFGELLDAGQADATEVAPLVSQALRWSRGETEAPVGKVELLTKSSDEVRLKSWTQFLNNDEYLDLSELAALRVVDVTSPPDPEPLTLLFLRLKNGSGWIHWVTQTTVGSSSRFELRLSTEAFQSMVRKGLEDPTDLRPEINRLYSVEHQKPADPELKTLEVLAVRPVVDESRIASLKKLLEEDSTLISSRWEAIRAFDIDIRSTYDPPRPDAGTTTFLVLFGRTKVKLDWEPCGSYL